jgi:N-methylhydantoinase A
MGIQVGIDVGGTFTDFVLFDASSQRLEYFKVPTTKPPDLGVLTGFRELSGRLGISLREIERIVHGTTVATNALLERRWAKTALITTEGFRDVLEIGRQDRPKLYNWFADRPEPLAPRAFRFEVPERVDASGNVIRPLDEKRVSELTATLRALDVEAVAVCFLFSYLNPAHERRVREILERELDAPIVISSEALPEVREYERASTTVMSAALQPVVGDYAKRLARKLRELGVEAPLEILQSNGGLVSAEQAARHAEGLLYSGPAGGVAGAQHVATAAGFPNVITLDMGGTSADVSLIVRGRAAQRVESELAGYRVRVPMVDVHSVGAGGGSIAWIDTGGALRVGPQSAGADPGPACYGRGEEPTVTDAHFVLGRFDPEGALGGRALDLKRARRAVHKAIAEPLGMSVEEAALGILDIADAHMERAVRVITVERGHDPREYALLAFGGAGPLHAASLAERLGIRRALIPAAAGVLSALGALTADLRRDRVQTLLRPLWEVEPRDIVGVFERLRREAEGELHSAFIEQMEHRPWVELRYRGQAYELFLEVGEPIWTEGLSRGGLLELETRFHAEHRRLYGYALEEHPVEIVSLRLESLGRTPKPALQLREPEAQRPPRSRAHREVHFAGAGALSCPIFARESLPPGAELAGPAVIEGRESTALLPPGWRAEVDGAGNLILEA